MTKLQNFGVPVGHPGRAGIIMPKVANRFRVIFNKFGDDTNPILLTQQVVSVTRPSIAFDLYDFSEDKSDTKIAWTPITLIFRDDVTNEILRAVMKQAKNQLNDGSHFSLKIETLDGSNDNVIESWNIQQCRMAFCEPSALDYSKADALTITLTIIYDSAELA